jgi:hypothetical protein
MTTPRVPVRNIINALGPSLKTSFRSMLRVSNTKLAGSIYLEATKVQLRFFDGGFQLLGRNPVSGN